MTRGALSAALSGRDAASLLPVVQHAAKHISDPRHTQMLCAVAHRLLDAYSMPGAGGAGGGSGNGLVEALSVLRERSNAELRVQDDMMSVKGMLDALLASGALQHV